MAKALRTAAIVVGGVALVATGIGAVAGVVGASALGLSAGALGTIATVAKVASLAAAGLSLAAGSGKPKGSVGGNPTKFKIDKEAGIPIAFGRTWSGGNVVHRQYYSAGGKKNVRESWVTVHSLGPVQSLGPLSIDKVPVGFSAAGAALGKYAGAMWLDSQLGACPEARALRGPSGDFPGWTAASKLSGLAADLWTLHFDSKGDIYPSGTPERGRLIEGVKAWDPRLDSSYPGGSGPCRRDDPSTHVYTQNMWILALQFALGFVQNGLLMAGGGLPVTGINVAPFVQAANTADANGWTAGGIVYATTDNDWDILKMLAQAGAGEVFPVSGILTCTHAAPRVSIGTITDREIIGRVVAPSTAPRTRRRNTIIPRVRLESHGWEVVPLDPVSVPDYVALDGGRRPREVDFPLVQSAKQGAEVAMYEMLDARELEPISLPCKLTEIGYWPGDCVTLDIAQANLVDRDVVLRTREIDMTSAGVTFTARTEDPAKHPFALGATGTPPPTPDLSVPELDLAAPAGWTAVAATVPAPGASLPVILIGGGVDNPSAEAVEFAYRLVGDETWSVAGTEAVTTIRTEIRSVAAGRSYEVSVRYQVRGVWGARLVLGPVEVGQAAVPWSTVTDPAGTKPDDNADVTGENTSKDTAAVGGRPSTEVKNAIDQALAAAEALAATVNVQDDRITAARGLVDQAAGDLLTLKGRVDAIVAGGDVGDLSARVETLEGADAQIEQAIAAVRQTIETGSNSNANLRASIIEQATALTTLDQSVADEFTAIRAGYPGTLAQFDQRITSVASATGAVQERTTTLEARVDSLAAGGGEDARVPAIIARLDGTEFARTTALSAEAGRIDNALSRVGTTESRLNGNEFTRSTATDALATRTTNVEARAGGLESTVGIQGIAIADAADKLSAARLRLKTAAGPGTEAEIELASDQAGGGRIRFGGNSLFVGEVEVQSADARGTTKFTGAAYEVRDTNGQLRVRLGLY